MIKVYRVAAVLAWAGYVYVIFYTDMPTNTRTLLLLLAMFGMTDAIDRVHSAWNGKPQ